MDMILIAVTVFLKFAASNIKFLSYGTVVNNHPQNHTHEHK